MISIILYFLCWNLPSDTLKFHLYVFNLASQFISLTYYFLATDYLEVR